MSTDPTTASPAAPSSRTPRLQAVDRLLLGAIAVFLGVIAWNGLITSGPLAAQQTRNNGTDGAPADTEAVAGSSVRDSDLDELNRLDRGRANSTDRWKQFIANRVRTSVVRIDVIKRREIPSVNPEEDSTVERVPVTYSAIALNQSGHLITLGDATIDAERYRVHMPIGGIRPAELVAADRRTNMAVLQLLDDRGRPVDVDITELGIRPVDFAQRDAQLGEYLMTVGNPYGLDRAISEGIISGTDRVLRVGAQEFLGVLQTTAPINPGDPGGGAFNLDGELIGLVWATYGGEESAEQLRRMMALLVEEPLHSPIDIAEAIRRFLEQQAASQSMSGGSVWNAHGVNFVLPSSIVERVAEELIDFGEVRRAWFGMSVQPEHQGGAGEFRVEVSDITPGGPADRAGLQRGDVILEINGEPMIARTGTGVIAQISVVRHRSFVGESLLLRIRRDSRELLIELVLAAEPESDDDGAPTPDGE